jgi:hypothetical protein
MNAYTVDDGIVVEYDYTEAGGDGWNEPRYEASIDIYSVRAGTVEMIDYIDPKMIALWEERILESVTEDEDDDYDDSWKRDYETNYER